MSDSGKQSFWEHLDVLRSALLKITAVTVVFGIVAFLFKETLFSIVLAPKESGFITYRWLAAVGGIIPGNDLEDFHVQLINTGLAEQFIIHMKTALCAGVMCASPYILYQLYRFVSPALYTNEREYAIKTIGSGYVLFIIGVLISYFLIFPLTFRFLGTYKVADDVSNMISLQSYMGTLIMMCLAMGIVFEMPVLAWMFAKMGFITSDFMRRYRKHAIVIILIVAAIITPTSDIFTLLLVSFPMWLLYEVSIWIIRNNALETKESEIALQ
jgi:Twin arginine targeting (Tat) protein translocase TatC